MSSSSSKKKSNKIYFLNSNDKSYPQVNSQKIKTQKFKDIEYTIMNNIHKKYGAKSKLKYKYLGLIMENLIFNKNTHLVSNFKDYMIWDFLEEFLKRYYKFYESEERVPKFASFYKNYLQFFCVPTFKENFYNEKIHNFNEKKAELFYNEYYKKKKGNNESELKDCGLYEETESDEDSESKNSKMNNIEKTVFNETIKKKIEKYSPINTSIPLPESDTKLKPDDSGLLITSSNESSLVNIMIRMTPAPKTKNKNNKINNNNNNKNDNSKRCMNNTVNNNKNINDNSYINNKKKDNNNFDNIDKTQKNNNSNLSNLIESSNSYRHSQKNLKMNTLNKMNSHTIEVLLNSQMKKRNISSGLSNRNRNNNNNIQLKDSSHTINNNKNDIFKNHLYNNVNSNSNKNKIMSYMGIYKKKSIPKSRNDNKLPEDTTKSQPKVNNYLININNTNNNPNIINIKRNSNIKNVTSVNNIINNNNNNKNNIQKSRNLQQSLSINSNTYSKNSFDKINNIKKKIDLMKNNNIEYILNQLKVHPFFTLKKNTTKKTTYNYSNSNHNKKIDDVKLTKKSQILSPDHRNNNHVNSQKGIEYQRNSAKNRPLNNHNKNKDIRSYSQKYVNSTSVLNLMKKSAFKLIRANINIKSNNIKDLKFHKKSLRNFSHNESQKSAYEDKNNNKNRNIKMSFDGIINNHKYNKKSNIINNNNNDAKNIHNVNININNQINIGGKQFHELISFSNFNKKNNMNFNNNKNNNIYFLIKNKNNNYISRNKNQSLDFHSYINNTNNANSVGANKMNSITDIQNGNNNIFKTQYKINNNGYSGTIIYNNNYNNNKNKNKSTKKIKLSNNVLFRSMKVLNNKNNKNKF